MYLPNEDVQDKLSHSVEFASLLGQTKKQNPSLNNEVRPLHENALPIKYSKYVHLQKLEVDLVYVIPVDYHSFYDNLNITSMSSSCILAEWLTVI